LYNNLIFGQYVNSVLLINDDMLRDVTQEDVTSRRDVGLSAHVLRYLGCVPDFHVVLNHLLFGLDTVRNMAAI
jgi:hypothetical protein